MTNAVTTKEHSQVAEFTPEQTDLITRTIAKNATPDELKLFLYRCKNMGLDPLKPGMIYFVKYNLSQPGTIVVGIDGFRSQAAKTGKHTGTKRGVIRDDKGKCIGAWAEVYRSDWTHPAREEVSMAEYNTGKAQWAKMPETMIKKVAESAALRMAFPDDQGGLYSQEEMDHADPHNSVRPTVGVPTTTNALKSSGTPIETGKIQNGNQATVTASLKHEAKAIEAEIVQSSPSLDAAKAASEYAVTFGKFKGKRLGEIPLDELKSYCNYIIDKANTNNGGMVSGIALEFMNQAEALTGISRSGEVPGEDTVPF